MYCPNQMLIKQGCLVSECDSEGTTDRSVVRTAEFTKTHSAVTESNENHVKGNYADDSQQPDLETVGLSVAVAFIALIAFATVGFVIKIRMKGYGACFENITKLTLMSQG